MRSSSRANLFRTLLASMVIGTGSVLESPSESVRRIPVIAAGRGNLGSIKPKVKRDTRPCLYCGKGTNHSQPFCSAEHIRLWRADNPGNGRYNEVAA
jgi:hypothetical protein